MHAFDYNRPTSVDQAENLLLEDPDAMVLAGGQTLLPMLKLRLGEPSLLIDLGGISELRGVGQVGPDISIGAMTPHADVAQCDFLMERIPALARLAAGIGDSQVRHMGTIGGSMAYSHPGADYPAAAVALGGTIHTNRRAIPADEFFIDTLETALEHGEIIVRVDFPVPRRAGYVKFPAPASGYVMAGAFVAETTSGVRVAINGAAGSVFRQPLCERSLSDCFSVQSLDDFVLESGDLIDDLHGTADYRAQLATVALRRAVQQAAD